MAELGQTNVADELIPGDPAALTELAASWQRLAEVIRSANEGMAEVDLGGWQGEAKDAFDGTARRRSQAWQAAFDALTASSKALTGYVTTLTGAQEQAAAAIRSWEAADGDKTAERAATESLREARARVRQSGDDTALQLAEPAGSIRTMAGQPKPGNKWDDVVGGHPDPKDVTLKSDRKFHILYGDGNGSGGHIYDSGVPDKTVFPEEWDDDKIAAEVEDVAKNPDQKPTEQQDTDHNGEPTGRSWVAHGTRDGVKITVIVNDDGSVRTAWPESGPGVCRNDEEGDPQPLEPEESGAEERDLEEEREEADEREQEAEEEKADARREGERAADREDQAEEAGDQEAAERARQDREDAQWDERAADREAELADRERDRIDQWDDADTEESDGFWDI